MMNSFEGYRWKQYKAEKSRRQASRRLFGAVVTFRAAVGIVI